MSAANRVISAKHSRVCCWRRWRTYRICNADPGTKPAQCRRQLDGFFQTPRFCINATCLSITSFL
jgi:hypothetical protein